MKVQVNLSIFYSAFRFLSMLRNIQFIYSDTDHITIVSEIDTVSLRISRRTAVFKMAANIFLSRAKEQSVHFVENYEILHYFTPFLSADKLRKILQFIYSVYTKNNARFVPRPNLYAGVLRCRSAKPPEFSFTVLVGRSATELSQSADCYSESGGTVARFCEDSSAFL